MKAQINGFSYSNPYAGHSFNKNRMGSKMASTILHSTILLVESIFAIYFALSINQSSFDILEEVFSLVTNSTYYPFIFYGLISLKLMALVFYLLIQKGIEQLLLIKIRALSSEFYSFLKQMDLVLAKLLLTLNLLQNIFPFCISLLLQVRQIILVKQYIHRRHDYYVGFIDQYIKLRALRVAFTLLNAVSYFLSMPNLFKIGFSLLFFIQIWILTKNKFQITLQKFPDLIICAEAAVHFTIEFIIVQYFVSKVNFGTASLTKYCFTFLGSFIYILFCKDYYFQYKAFEWITKMDRKLQIKVFSTQVFRILENGALNLDDRYSKANIRSCHLLMKCLNKNCQIQEESDPFSNRNFSPQITQSCSEQVMLLSFVDCLYETEIQKFTNCTKQKGLIFDYCQFLLNTDHKIYRLLFLVSKLQQMKLGFIETQQIQKFRYYLQTYLSNLCASLYEGKANFERAEIGQKTIQSIKDSIDEYLRQNKMIWHKLKDGLIEAEELKQRIKSNSYLLEKIDSKWEQIHDCLKLSLIWNKWHLFYTLFIRNQYKWERKKQLGQFHCFQKFMNTIKSGQTQIKLVQNLFSQIQIGFISSFLRDKELIINWVSQSYDLKTGFGLQELKFSPLESIFVEREKQNYCQFLGKLMKFDEKMYAPLKSHISEKQKGQSAVLMLFKPILYIQKGLTFLTLVKFQEQLTRTIQLRSSPQIIKNKQIMNIEIQDNIFAKDLRFVFREDHYDRYRQKSEIRLLIYSKSKG